MKSSVILYMSRFYGQVSSIKACNVYLNVLSYFTVYKNSTIPICHEVTVVAFLSSLSSQRTCLAKHELCSSFKTSVIIFQVNCGKY